MKIIVDENIPYGKEAFGTLGDVQTVHGRKITRETVADADALVVRSITKVNEALLSGTPVRFVGTCTIGEDHIDKAYLAANGITFTSAPGCNANSVGEYITAALLVLADRYQLRLKNCPWALSAWAMSVRGYSKRQRHSAYVVC
jgi:erythronate-4-phosphate dehydrogenase